MRHLTPRLILAASILLFAALTPPTARAQATDDDIGDKVSFLALFPNLRALPAPTFLQPGLRVTFSSGAATGAGGPAGGGFIQYDVLTVDGGQVLLQQTNFGDAGAGLAPLGAQGARGYPGLGAFWLNPSVLSGAERFNSATLSVTRVNKVILGQNVTVLRFQSQTTGGRLVTEYDAATGLMTFDSSSAGGADAQLVVAAVRTLPLPWAAARAPNWVRPGVQLSYTGIRRTLVGGGGGIDEPAELVATLSQTGARWSVSDVTYRYGVSAQGAGRLATGQAQLTGALWVPPGALQVVFPAEGVLVDADPVTGAQVFMARGDGGALVVQEVMAAARTTSIYDPTFGALSRSIVETVGVASSQTVDVSRATPDASLQASAAQAPLPEDPPRSAAGAAGGAGGAGGGGGGGSVGCAGSGALELMSALSGLCLMGLQRRWRRAR